MAYPNLPPPPPPPEHVGSTNVTYNTSLRLDLSYLTTQMGILRIIIAVLNAIGAICIASTSFRNHGKGVFFTVVSLSGLWYTVLVVAAYSFHVVEKYNDWRWLKMEVASAVGLAALNLITSTIVVAFGSAGYSAAGFFGYLCMVSYGVEAFLRGRSLSRGELPQGHVGQCKQTPARPDP